MIALCRADAWELKAALRVGVILGWAALSLGASCARLPEVRPRAATIAQVCPSRIKLRLEADLFNDNPAGANVSDVRIDLTVGTRKLPRIDEKLSAYIPKKEWTTIAVSAWVPVTDLPSIVVSPVLFKDLPYEARGTVWGTAAGTSFSKDFVLKGAITREQLAVMAQKSAAEQVKSPVGWCAQ